MIAPFLVLRNVTQAITSYVPSASTFRSRVRAIASGVSSAVVVKMDVCQGTLYTTGGTIEWAITLSVTCLSRDGDQACAELLGAVHEALLQDMTFGIDGLFFNPAFTVAFDAEDTDESLFSMSAAYNFTITTENSNAGLA